MKNRIQKFFLIQQKWKYLPNTISASLLPVFGTIGIVLTFVDANVFANGGTYGIAVLPIGAVAVPINGLFVNKFVLSSGKMRIGIRWR